MRLRLNSFVPGLTTRANCSAATAFLVGSGRPSHFSATFNATYHKFCAMVSLQEERSAGVPALAGGYCPTMGLSKPIPCPVASYSTVVGATHIFFRSHHIQASLLAPCVSNAGDHQHGRAPEHGVRHALYVSVAVLVIHLALSSFSGGDVEVVSSCCQSPVMSPAIKGK